PLALPQRPAQRDQAAKMFAVFHRDVLGEGGAPGEPDFDAPTDVEYTSDVVDASVSEVDVRDDGMTVALEGSEADVQVGDIVMIDPTEELPFGSAVKVEEVSSSGGVTTVEGVVPEPAEVYDSVIINEEYDKEDLLAGGASLQSIELTDEGISIDEDLGVYGKVTGSLTINDFEGHAFVFVPPGLLAKYFGYVDVDFEADLTVDLDFSISALPSNLKKIRLGSPIPLPYCGVPGWGLNVVFYLNTDVSGHIIVTTDIQMSTSAHRDLIGDIDQTTKSSTRTFDSVSIAVDGKIGPSAVVALMLLDEPVFDVGAEFGAAAKVESTQHPGLTCGDAAIWLYGEAFAEFVGEMADSAKVTATIFDEDNSPLEMGIHVENGELVPECTWDPGADEEPDVGDPSNPGGEGTDNPNDPENPETPEGPTTDASDFTYVIGDGVEYGNLYGTASYGYGAYITGYKGSSSDVVIPASIDGIDVLYVGISDAGRRIKSLDFSHAKSLRDINLYIGEYDVNFGKLDELERVAATLTCRFTGDFDLSQCGSLKHLIFSDGASLGGFMRFGTESLETISIGITNIAGTFTIGDAPRLREAEFVDVGISDIIFGNCPSLEKLTVINTDITNLDVSGFPQLNELTCFDNNISDTSALEAWASQPGHTANLVGYDAGLLSERK
ncbi:hypothetical protein B5F79_10740, partial [Olsenella sp. An285]|uniref:leucine-rich repeat domain-containing protein n=1 Tax=Olsenella sp. An285 TaxID=1965621 RepID=UPI000B573994